MWSGQYWAPNGGLARASERYAVSLKGHTDEVAYASSLYSAATRSLAEARSACSELRLLSMIRWIWQFIWLGASALEHVNLAWKDRQFDEFNLDQVETSCAIWLRVGWIAGGFRARVRDILSHEIFSSILDVGDLEVPISPHTRGFFISHAMTSGRLKRTAWMVKFMERCADHAEEQGSLEQASRVWRHAEKHWQKLRSCNRRARFAHERAVELAKNSGAADQLKKLAS